MLKKFNMTLILSALLIALTSTAALAAPPPLPSSFYGTVQLSGADVPPGTIISAWIGDVEYVSTVGFLDGDRSVFVLDVPGDDPDTPGIEGGVDGDSIVFQVAGFNADQTAIWEGGTHVELNLTATPPPLPPIADDQNLVTDEDTPLAITLTALDPNNDPLTFSIVSDPSNGTLSGTPPDLIYTPAPDFNGADSFTFVANDGTFDSNVATISITVNPINDAPRLDPIADQVMDEGETRDLGVVAVDPDGDTVTLSAAGLPAFASFSDEGGGFGILSLTPGFDDAGVYPDVTISASDGTLVSTRMFTITVNDVIPLPRARFSVGKPSNVARSSDGASIVDFSSVWSASTSHQPENAIDNNVSSAWSTGSGQVTDQWIKVQLTGGEPHVVDRVVLRGSSSNNGIKNFEIRVSTTGTADADFTTVLVESLPQDNEFHEFTFAPTSAAYIQLFILDNWGSGSNIGVRHFEVWTRDREGGIVSLFEGPPASIAGVSSESSVGTRAELAIDLSSSSIWRTAQGQTTDQWIKVELGGGLIYTIGGVRLQSSSTIEAARDFEIRVSTTTADDGAFTTVFTATGAATTDLQEFSFAPVQARFVQLFIRNNNGSSCCVRVGMFQVLTPDGANVSRLEGVGASVVDASSWSGFSSRPDLAIDYPTNTRWQTATGAVTDQWIKVRLIEGAPYLINKVMLDSPPGNVSPRVFEIRVSNATLDDADFTTVLTATLPSDGLAHWFSLPQVEAKYVQLFIRDNRGSNVIQVERFQVFSPELGGAVVPFDDLSQHPDGEIVAWDWDFGDSTGSTTQHPVHTFLGPGTYPVSLTVTDGVGNTDTTNMDYSVLLPPTVDFTWSPLEPDEGQTTALSGSAADEDGIIVAWRWTFSHSTTVRTTQDTSTSFPDNGDYVVDLTVTDSQLLTSISTQGITALNAPPSVSVPDKTVYFGEAVRVTPNVSEPGTADRTTLAYLWDLGDGNTYDQKVINYVYATVGVYDVSLTVTDKDGGVGSDTATFIVEKRPTTLIYVGARSGEDGQPVRLRAKLRDDPSGGDGISGKTIQFTLGTQTTSAVTDDRGIAETNLIFSGGSGLYTVTATFVEDDAYLGSSDTETFAVAGLFPSTITATLAPGESVTEIKRGVIPRAFKLADILLAFDTTGSMRGVINKAKAQGVDIVEDLSGLIEDGRFAVISHGDYPGLFESFGYRATYGASSDFPYRLDQPLTGDTALVVNAINGIRGTQGADGPESYVTVMYESVAELVGDPNPTEGVLGYRLESKKILIHFHDNIPHDNNLNEGVPGKTGTSTTGGEPGRNGVIDETSDPDRIGPPYNDDLNLQTVLDLMANNGVTMIPVRTGLSQRIYWEHWAELTGGSVVFMSSGSVAVSDAVREAVEREASEVDRVTLTVSAGFEDWVTFSPSEYLNVITPIELSFEVTITPPADTLPGTYDFTISLVGDGFEYALQTVVIEVGGNDAPIAQDDAYEVDEDSPLTVPVPGVLVNDSDPDGDPLTAVLVDDVLNGSLSLNEDGSFEYVPDPDYNGPESFTYRANDGELDSEIATVSITVNPVNDPPVADDQAVTTDEDTSVGITLAGSDVDGDALTYSVVDAPASGTLSGTAPDLTYTPNPDYNGPDSFTFKVNDGVVDSNLATVSITVNPVNDPPVADDQAVTTDEDTSVGITLAGSDVDGDALTYSVVDAPASGALSGTAPDLTYTPNPDYNGPDSFTFKVNDGIVDSNIATVSITVNPVNDTPVADDQSLTTDEDTSVGITLTGSDIDGDPLTYSILDTPASGALSGAAPDLIYAPDLNYNGPDSFTFKVNDGTVDSNVATVSITVNPVNDAPMADDQAVSTDEDTPLAITLTGSDVDGDSLTFSIVDVPTSGVLSGTAPDLVYSSAPDYNGPDSFTFKVNDGTVDSNVATVSITVIPVNDPPVAEDDTATTDEDVPVVVDVLANDSDVDGDSLAVASVTQGVNGTVTVNPDNTLTYAPTANFYGVDSFTYTASDGQGGTDAAAVTVTINPVNDPPTVHAGGPYTVDEGASIPVSATGSDVDGDLLEYAWDLDHDGSFETPGQTVTFSAAMLDGPSDLTIRVQVNDPGGLSASDETSVNVINVPPTVEAGPDQSAYEWDVVHLAPATFTDPGIPDTHTATINWGDGSALEAGVVSESDGSGAVAGSHAYDIPGTYVVEVCVTDDDGGRGCDTLTVEVMVRPPQNLKRWAIDKLQPYSEESKRIEKAIREIEDSLDPELWLDEDHLEPQHGHKVFSNERHAVIELMHLLDGEGDGEPSEDALTAAQEVIEILVRADRTLAETMLEEVDGIIAVDPKRQDQVDAEVERAKAEFEVGDTEREVGNYEKAIQHYRKAWEHAWAAKEMAEKGKGK